MNLGDSSSEAYAYATRQGILLESTGADYAEYISKDNIEVDFAPCDIVGIRDGKVVASTEASDQFMVVSQRPVVIGNSPMDRPVDQFELVAFVGQVYVKVRGAVKAGQYIVASPTEAGVGIAKDGADLTNADLKRVVGQAWETSASNSLRVVKVGLTIASISSAKAENILKLEAELTSLRDELKATLSELKAAK
jgi:hypothetical protein